MANFSFSNKVNEWLNRPGRKTFGELEIVFGEKSFAVAFLLLMITAALPLPTGGITHIFEIITMLLALELIAGRKKIWTPQSWRERDLGKTLQNKVLPKIITFIRWFERRSQKRLGTLLGNTWFLRLVGGIVFLLALAAAVALPFSGLDTLPALGIVLIAMGLILEDALILLVALVIGVAGVIVELSLGSVALHFLR